MNTTIPGQAEEDEDAGGDMSEASGTSGANDGAKDNIMEVDQDVEGSTLISAPSNKRKLTSDEDDTITSHSGYPLTSSIVTSTSSLSLEPFKKKSTKLMSSVAASSNPQLKAAPSRHSKGASSARSSNHAGTSRTSKLSSSDLLVHEMQGSINMLMSTVWDSME